MQDLMANGNYSPFLTQALTPPILGAGAMSGYGGPQGIGPQTGNPAVGNPVLGPFGQGSFGQNGVNFGPAGGVGQQGIGQQFGQPQQLAAQQQQQQIATTLHQLAHHVAAQSAMGQQVGGTLQQLAQYCIHQVMAGQQFAQLLNQLAHQYAWQAQAPRIGGVGTQAIQGPPFGYGLANPVMANPVMYGQPGAQAWGFNRPIW